MWYQIPINLLLGNEQGSHGITIQPAANVWTRGDFVTGVFALLLLMSLASWIVILLKALGHRQIQRARQRRGCKPAFQRHRRGHGPAGRGFKSIPFRQLAHRAMKPPPTPLNNCTTAWT